MLGWASSVHAGMANSGATKQFLRELGREHPAVFHEHLNWPMACNFGPPSLSPSTLFQPSRSYPSPGFEPPIREGSQSTGPAGIFSGDDGPADQCNL